MGIVVAMLSVTGVYIWWKKRRARILQRKRSAVSDDVSFGAWTNPGR